MSNQMPVLFIGHGSPMNVVLDNAFTRDLQAWGQRLPKPRAIMVVSAHWLTEGTFVGCMDRPETIYDFYGFPRELYELTYPCPGAPAEAERITHLPGAETVRCRSDWGLDHGAWSVLRHLFPKADLPTFQLSLDYTFNDWHPKPLAYHYDLAKKLTGLRREGILIIGSGNVVHNLGMLDFEDPDASPFGWAEDFDAAVKQTLVSQDDDRLIELGTKTSDAVPTPDHYLPMVYAVALRERAEPVIFTHEGFQHGSISMRCFQFG